MKQDDRETDNIGEMKTEFPENSNPIVKKLLPGRACDARRLRRLQPV